LTYLINLCLAPLTLKIDQLSDALPPENVVAAASALLKPQPLEHAAQVVEIDVRIRPALQNPKPKLLMLAHPALKDRLSRIRAVGGICIGLYGCAD
jgi:hypothetical protein